ncbi:MAG: NADH-quinone oxidoreductase subunit J [Planctomycetes bacterium]|nr:NADH-quinone oxidoreductase subunit J [Planctomycetota bacterium]
MLEAVIFFLLAGLAVAAGVAILLSTSIVRMAYWLITMLIAVGGLYFLLGAYFVGVIQILVYVGGVAVLLVFGVMLTSRQLAPKLRPGRGEVVWLALVGFVLLEALTLSILHTRWQQNAMAPANSVGEIGRSLLGEFLGPFELVSVLLLVAMLGAAYLARPKVPTQGPQHAKGTTVP